VSPALDSGADDYLTNPWSEMKDVPEAAAAAIKRASRGATIKQLEKSEVGARIEKEGGHAFRLYCGQVWLTIWSRRA
jgi:hypothetical protein